MNCMRRFLGRFMELLLRGIAFIYPYNVNQRIKSWGTRIYTIRIRNFIGELGSCTLVEKSCLLQGGGIKRLIIGDHTVINAHALIELWSKYGDETYEPEVRIGNHCNIGEYCHISSINKITIGDGLLTGRFVYIGDNSHGGLSLEETEIAPENRKLKTKGIIMIGKNVWIGDKVTILGVVTIGDNAIIDAGTVVTHDVPPNSIVRRVKCVLSKSFKKLDSYQCHITAHIVQLYSERRFVC